MDKNALPSASSVIFLHIPRTGGTTMHRIIERHYSPEEIYSFGPDAHGSLRELKSLSAKRRSQIRMLKGHLPYGVHTLLSGSTTYFTFLRDPIERAISVYHYIKRIPKHPMHGHLVRCGTMKAFFESGMIRMTDNGQTRMLSGVWDEVPFGATTQEMLEHACRNLKDRFSMVGLTSHFDETLLLLRHVFDWQDICYVRENVTQGRPFREDLDLEVLSFLEELNALDHVLYNYGRHLFFELVHRRGLKFKIQVWVFKYFNWRYGRQLKMAKKA